LYVSTSVREEEDDDDEEENTEAGGWPARDIMVVVVSYGREDCECVEELVDEELLSEDDEE